MNGVNVNPVFADLNNAETLKKNVLGIVKGTRMKPFPIEVFPEQMQQIILETNKCLNFPIDFTGASMLYAASLAIGNTYKLQVKKTWLESAVLYIAIVGRAGTNKSHPLSFAIKPLIENDSRTYAEYEKKKLEYDYALNLTRKERESQNIDEPIKPRLEKFIVSDTTPEALTYVHETNKRGIGVYVDELAGWFKNFNRYHNGAEQEFWLSNWSGKPIIIDRKTGEPIRITKPFISVCGTIQTAILDEMAKGNRGANGFIDRILSVIPEGLKVEAWTDNELDQIHFDNWNNIIEDILSNPLNVDETGNPNPEILTFHPKAWSKLKEWQSNNAALSNNAENEMETGIFTKLEVYCLRFSLILQVLQNSCDGIANKEITAVTVGRAIQLTEFFRATALKVHSIISNASPLDKLPNNKKRLYDALPDIVKTGEAITLGDKFNVASRTVKRFLGEKGLFARLRQGEYEKLL
jgi:hypothetical protein